MKRGWDGEIGPFSSHTITVSDSKLLLLSLVSVALTHCFDTWQFNALDQLDSGRIKRKEQESYMSSILQISGEMTTANSLELATFGPLK